jgi:hypothetical protein
MPQIQSSYEEARIPFAKMSYTPDVPSTALGANEYNAGINVEADVRGIRSVAGDQEFFDAVPGTPTYISGGFRADGNFWFIVATEEGQWYATYDGTWNIITPGGTAIVGYGQSTNITEAWNGTVPFFNDTINPPMVWLEGASALIFYSNLLPTNIYNIATTSGTQQTITLNNSFTSTGSSIAGTTLTIGTVTSAQNPGVGQYISSTFLSPGTKIIANIAGSGSGSTWTISTSPGAIGPTAISGGPYSAAPYVGGDQIEISGVNNFYNGTFEAVTSTMTTITYFAVPGGGYPGLNSGSVAPLYSWNYNPNWASVRANFMRLYSTPNVGSILVAGNLTAVPLAAPNTTEVYPVTVQWSQAFGLNQAPLTWQPTITNVANQLEVPLRGPAIDAFPSNGNFFLCSYWDTVVFSPLNYSTTSAPILGVRLYNQGRGLLTSNCWANADRMVYGIDARDIWVFDGNDFTGIGNQRVKNWFYDQLDPQYYDRVFMEANTQKNQIEIYYPDALAFNGVPNKMLAYRYDIDCWNAPREVAEATQVCESPIYVETAPNVWEPNLSSRTLVYARGYTGTMIAQRDVGYTLPPELFTAELRPITSLFQRDNIKLLKDYSGKLMVHRLLPEAVNVGAIPFTGTNNIEINPSTGSIEITIEGANSVGASAITSTTHTMTLNTDNPWVQIDQNSRRVNTIKAGNTSSTNCWMLSATTWQFTQVEDDR